MKLKMILLISIMALALASCDARSEELAPMAIEEIYVEREVAESSYGSNADMVASAPAPDTTVERMVIQNASLSIAVDNPDASMERVKELADELNGYVVSADMYQTTLDSGATVLHAAVSIRVPSEKLNDAIETIKDEATQPVISENITSQDVTADYVDLSSRLTNLEATEIQLQKIMDEAVKTEDVLAVYSRLVDVRGQIEVIKGQMKYYEESARLSMVSVELIADEAAQPLTIGGWQLNEEAEKAVRALERAVKWLAKAAIWIFITILPVVLLVFGPPALIVWLIWRRRSRQKKAAQLPPDPLIPGQKG